MEAVDTRDGYEPNEDVQCSKGDVEDDWREEEE